MKKILNDLKNKVLDLKEKNMGIVILGVLVLIFLVFTAIYLFGARNISKIEEKQLKDNSKELVNYLEDITLTKGKNIDRYIIFALDYSYNVNSKNSLTVSEIYEFISEKFTLKTSEEEIKNIGITEAMLARNIVYDPQSNSYVLSLIGTNAQKLSETPITYYKLEKISKLNKKKYVVSYRTYTIKNPYDILNYYLDKNNKTEGISDENGNMTYDLVDITPFRNYLIGSSKLGALKNAINEKDLSKFAKKGKKVKVTYIVKDNNILIDKIK